MKKQLLTGVLAVSTLAPVIIAQVAPTQASSIGGTTCSSLSIENKVTPNLRCQIGTTNNDTVSEDNKNFANFQVNQDGIFSRTEWLLVGKDEDGGSIDISSTFPFQKQSGSFNVSSLVPANWTDVMLVFKAGNGNNISPENYVAYLLAENSGGTLKGEWNSPFFKQGQTTDVSHISLYYRTGTTTPVPTPALLPAVLGMGGAAFRKKKQEEKAAQKA